MQEACKILNKVGVALFVVVVIDIAIFTCCFIYKISYSSSFNIFSVVVGLLLIKGSVHAVRFVTLN